MTRKRTNYKDLVESLPQIVFETNVEGRITYANPIALESFGYTVQDLDKGVNVLEALVPKDHKRASKNIQKNLTGEGTGYNEYTALRKDGTTFEIAIYSSPIIHKQKPVGLRGVIVDISAQKRAEDELRKLSTAVRQSPVSIIITNVLGEIEYVNPKFTELTGYQAEEVIGKNPRLLKSGKTSPQVYRELWDTITAGKTWQGEFHNKKKNGDLYWEYAQIAPIFRDDEITHFIALKEDITERKRLDGELRKSQESLATAQNIAHLGNWEWDSGTDVACWSDEVYRIFGYSPQELSVTYETFVNSVHPDDREFVKGKINEAIEDGGLLSIDFRITRPDGAVRMVQEQAVVKVRQDGKGVRIVGTVLDITDHMRLEQQLRQAQKMEAVGRLAGGVAHDFNNILTAILGYSDMLLNEESADGYKHKALQEIKMAGERASSIVSQLLAFSRKQIIQPVVLDLNESIKDLSKMLRRLIGEDIELITVLEQCPSYVKADPGQIDQVIMNLAINARDAMPEGGKLMLETANVELDDEYGRRHDVLLKTGPFVQLSISDSGHGMDRKTQGQIFEPFFTTKTSEKGTGLGLSTVYGIIKQAEGFIWVYSEPGHGTTFKVYLPCTQERIATSFKKERAAQSVRNETILLVEDSPELLELMSQMLKKHGYKVLPSSSSEEAERIFQMTHPSPIHLLLTDVVLQGKSGRDLAETLTKMRPTLKVLYMSGYTDETVVRHGIVEPGINFLQKPFTQESLASKVREVIDS